MSYRLLAHVTCTHRGDRLLVLCQRNTYCLASRADLADPIRYSVSARPYVVCLRRVHKQARPESTQAKRVCLARSGTTSSCSGQSGGHLLERFDKTFHLSFFSDRDAHMIWQSWEQSADMDVLLFHCLD